MHHNMAFSEKLQALNQQLENIKQGVVKNTGLDGHTQVARLVALGCLNYEVTAVSSKAQVENHKHRCSLA